MDIKNNKKAFTLVELLVTSGIVAIVASMFFVNYHSTNKRSELIMAIQNLASDLRQAQSNSLGLFLYDSSSPSGGWGVHMNINDSATSYKLFADNDGDYSYDSGESNTIFGGKNVNLPDGVIIDSINNGSSVNLVDITFYPPDPDTYIYSSSATSTSVTITLKETVSETTKAVTVNFTGLVDVID